MSQSMVFPVRNFFHISKMFWFNPLTTVYFPKRIFSEDNINNNSNRSIVRTRLRIKVKQVIVVVIQVEKTSEGNCLSRLMCLSIFSKWYISNSGSTFLKRVKEQTYFPYLALDKFQVTTRKREKTFKVEVW